MGRKFCGKTLSKRLRHLPGRISDSSYPLKLCTSLWITVFESRQSRASIGSPQLAAKNISLIPGTGNSITSCAQIILPHELIEPSLSNGLAALSAGRAVDWLGHGPALCFDRSHWRHEHGVVQHLVLCGATAVFPSGTLCLVTFLAAGVCGWLDPGCPFMVAGVCQRGGTKHQCANLATPAGRFFCRLRRPPGQWLHLGSWHLRTGLVAITFPAGSSDLHDHGLSDG